MRLRDQVLFSVAVVAVAAAAAAVAGQRVEERSGRAGWAERAERAEILGLTQAQKDEMRKLRNEAIHGRIRQRADVALARLDLRQLIDRAEPDAQAIDAKLKQMGDLHVAGLRARVGQQLALRRLLTPEQREKLRDLQPLRQPIGRRPRMGAGETEPPVAGENASASAESDDALCARSLTAL